MGVFEFLKVGTYTQIDQTKQHLEKVNDCVTASGHLQELCQEMAEANEEHTEAE